MSAHGFKSPYQQISTVWEDQNTAKEDILHRKYHSRTLCSIINSVLNTARELDVHAGFCHIPEAIRNLTEWSGAKNLEFNSGFSLINTNDQKISKWTNIPASFSPRSLLGREVWISWVNDNSSFTLSAHKLPSSEELFSLEDIWEMKISCANECNEETVKVLETLCEKDGNLIDVLSEMKSLFSKILGKEGKNVFDECLIRQAVNLADDIDSWVQDHQKEFQWITLQNQLLNAMAGELRSENLLPNIARAVRQLLRYDLLEILIFNKVGIHYKEFISWRNNYTGIGDEKMSILLKEDFVSEIISEKVAMQINPQKNQGVMNKRLAELAELEDGLMIPLSNLKNLEGIMALYFRQSVELPEEHLEKISEIGSLVGRSIEASNAHMRMQRMATVDALTNIYNRRYFTDQIKSELKRSKRYGRPLSLIMIDIDHFKHYNDTHGHLMGDRLLKKFAQVITISVRSIDIVARYGGEEFVVVLPESSAQAGSIVAEKIRKEILAANFTHGETQPLGHISASFGVADSTINVENHKDLINNADLALYRAKSEGRNRTLVYHPNLDSVT